MLGFNGCGTEPGRNGRTPDVGGGARLGGRRDRGREAAVRPAGLDRRPRRHARAPAQPRRSRSRTSAITAERAAQVDFRERRGCATSARSLVTGPRAARRRRTTSSRTSSAQVFPKIAPRRDARRGHPPGRAQRPRRRRSTCAGCSTRTSRRRSSTTRTARSSRSRRTTPARVGSSSSRRRRRRRGSTRTVVRQRREGGRAPDRPGDGPLRPRHLQVLRRVPARARPRAGARAPETVRWTRLRPTKEKKP